VVRAVRVSPEHTRGDRGDRSVRGHVGDGEPRDPVRLLAIASLTADLLLVTHEHVDHNGVEVVGGDPVILCSTAGKLPSPIGEVDLLIVPVGGGFTIGAQQAALLVERISPRWAVPMHYRTPRTSFLETADEFLELMANVERLERPSFDNSQLPRHDGPLVVVPAAP
jgi:L-ascorbate metabolism protein UlaG (beta-lactamase superfamily)